MPVAISAAGALVRGGGNTSGLMCIQNVGTTPVALYVSADGSGDPIVVLAGGVAANDGLGSSFTSDNFRGTIFAKAPAGGGQLLVT